MYPYQGHNLFAEPEWYRYADSSDPAFLDAWRAYRDSAIERLQRAYPDPADYPTIAEPVTLSEPLDRLVLRYEIRRDIGPKDGPKASLAEYVAFAQRLAESGSLKHLSVLMKLCDAFCSVDVPYPLSEAVVGLLRAERRLVDAL